MYQHCGTACWKQITYELAFVREKLCLVPVRRFPSSSRSIRFGDLSEANGHGPRDPKRFGREDKWGLGTRQKKPLILRFDINCARVIIWNY